MTSLIPSAVRSNRRLTVVFTTMTFLVGLPVVLFIAMTVQGFVDGSGNEKPIDVVATGITKSSTIIKWDTDKKTQAVVEYGTNPASLNLYAPEVENQREHSVSLTLLSPATTYYFQLRINGTVYDNEGVPWTFITKTKDGEDAAEAIKGISTRIAREDEEATEEAGISTGNCTVTTCEEIKNNLGKGCSSADYLKCISTDKSDGETTSDAEYQSYTTPTPSPTVILIVSNLCKLDYVQSGNDCTEWMWDSIDTKPQICRTGFDRYIVQCKNTSFTEGSDKKVIWYYNNALTNIASNAATLKVRPTDGETVYCQVRVEDEMGGETHSTPWVRASKKCEY